MARLASFKMETEVFNNSPDETTYFRMVLNRENATNSLWCNAGYQNQPDHESFAQLLQAPRDDAAAIVKEHFPVPYVKILVQRVPLRDLYYGTYVLPSLRFDSSSQVVWPFRAYCSE